MASYRYIGFNWICNQIFKKTWKIENFKLNFVEKKSSGRPKAAYNTLCERQKKERICQLITKITDGKKKNNLKFLTVGQ